MLTGERKKFIDGGVFEQYWDTEVQAGELRQWDICTIDVEITATT